MAAFWADLPEVRCQSQAIRLERLLISAELFLLALSIIPLSHGISDNLVHTKFLFSPIGSIFRFSSSFILLVIFSILFTPFLRSIFNRPSLVIEDNYITVCTIICRKSDMTEIIDILPTPQGGLTIILGRDQRDINIPLLLYKQPSISRENILNQYNLIKRRNIKTIEQL